MSETTTKPYKADEAVEVSGRNGWRKATVACVVDNGKAGQIVTIREGAVGSDQVRALTGEGLAKSLRRPGEGATAPAKKAPAKKAAAKKAPARRDSAKGTAASLTSTGKRDAAQKRAANRREVNPRPKAS